MASRSDAKTPFYDIQVLSYDEKRSAALTDTIKRLVDSITISDNLTIEEDAQANELRITLKEHTYLPEDNNFRPQSPRYFGEITNRPGSILDLRFDSEKGFTFVSKEEMESGQTTASRTQSNTSEPVVFVFQEDNFIDITWGYMEPYKSKKRRFKIIQMICSGGSGGNGNVEIVAHDLGNDLKKARAQNGVVFKRNQEVESLKAVLFRISNSFGAKLIVDGKPVIGPVQNLKASVYDRFREEVGDTLPVDRPFTLDSKTDIFNFLNRLARDHESYVRFDYDVTDNMYIINFNLSSNIFDKPLFTFEYNDTQSQVLNYTISSMFGLTNRETASTSTDEQKTRKDTVPIAVTKPSDTNKVAAPVSDEHKERFKDNIGAELVGQSNSTPAENDDAVTQFNQTAVFKAAHMAQLNFSTVGDPEYIPGAVEINNIGARYSGRYKITQVQHSINSSGYTCNWSGLRLNVNEGGIKSENLASDKHASLLKVTEPDKKGP